MSTRWGVVPEGVVEFWPKDRAPYDAGEKAFTVQIVCSDRSSHKKTRLAASVFGFDRRWLSTLTHGDSMVVYCSEPGWDGESDSDQLYVEFRCCRCGRTPRIALAKWQDAMDGPLNPSTWDVGVLDAEVDVSGLPY